MRKAFVLFCLSISLTCTTLQARYPKSENASKIYSLPTNPELTTSKLKKILTLALLLTQNRHPKMAGQGTLDKPKKHYN